jgi:hypothetical protein
MNSNPTGYLAVAVLASSLHNWGYNVMVSAPLLNSFISTVPSAFHSPAPDTLGKYKTGFAEWCISPTHPLSFYFVSFPLAAGARQTLLHYPHSHGG